MTKKTKNVTISLDEYLELIEFKQSFLKGDSIMIHEGIFGQQKIEFITESKMIDHIKQENRVSFDAWNKLKNDLDKVSQMNYFEFRKWKKSVNFKD